MPGSPTLPSDKSLGYFQESLRDKSRLRNGVPAKSGEMAARRFARKSTAVAAHNVCRYPAFLVTPYGEQRGLVPFGRSEQFADPEGIVGA